jgi:hypothetical protein
MLSVMIIKAYDMGTNLEKARDGRQNKNVIKEHFVDFDRNCLA